MSSTHRKIRVGSLMGSKATIAAAHRELGGLENTRRSGNRRSCTFFHIFSMRTTRTKPSPTTGHHDKVPVSQQPFRPDRFQGSIEQAGKKSEGGGTGRRGRAAGFVAWSTRVTSAPPWQRWATRNGSCLVGIVLAVGACW